MPTAGPEIMHSSNSSHQMCRQIDLAPECRTEVGPPRSAASAQARFPGLTLPQEEQEHVWCQMVPKVWNTALKVDAHGNVAHGKAPAF